MRPRTVLRIARWEVTRGVGSVDRRTALVGAAALLLVLALVPAAIAQGTAFDRGVYRVGVSPDHPLADPVAADPAFAVRDPDPAAFESGDLELFVSGERGVYRDTEKGRAAMAALRRSVARYNDRRMAAEQNRTAAYPVTVTLRYVPRDEAERLLAPSGDGENGGGDGGSGGNGSGGGAGGAGGGAGGAAGTDTASGGGIAAPALGADLFGTGTTAGTPSDISPPFPFQSLVLAFAFVLPLNFVVQAYGSSVLNERVNRRGELLLVAPVSRGEIIAGKTLPYLGASLGIAAAVALAVGGGPLSVFGVAPLALLFLGSTFVGGMFARSFKELTFVTVTVSVVLTSYAFVPAIFTDVGSVALVSPLTLVVRDLTGAAVTPGDVAFSTLPPTLVAVVLFALGAGVYREEDMFTQRPVGLKALDALAAHVRGARSLALVVAALVPLVFVAELLAVATLFALPGGLSIPLLLVVVAVVEELAKSLPVLAGFLHARFPRTGRAALAAGAASGVGFFLAEKLTLVVQLVGLPELAAGAAVFQTGAADSPAMVAALLVAPLALHVVTAATSAAGAARGREWYGLGLGAAVCLHVGYNLAVVSALG